MLRKFGSTCFYNQLFCKLLVGALLVLTTSATRADDHFDRISNTSGENSWSTFALPGPTPGAYIEGNLTTPSNGSVEIGFRRPGHLYFQISVFGENVGNAGKARIRIDAANGHSTVLIGTAKPGIGLVEAQIPNATAADLVTGIADSNPTFRVTVVDNRGQSFIFNCYSQDLMPSVKAMSNYIARRHIRDLPPLF